MDLGCHDGKWTEKIAETLLVSEIYGVDLDEDAGQLASSRGIQFVLADLHAVLPFQDNSMDVVHSNQVIEHLSDVDTIGMSTNEKDPMAPRMETVE